MGIVRCGGDASHQGWGELSDSNSFRPESRSEASFENLALTSAQLF